MKKRLITGFAIFCAVLFVFFVIVPSSAKDGEFKDIPAQKPAVSSQSDSSSWSENAIDETEKPLYGNSLIPYNNFFSQTDSKLSMTSAQEKKKAQEEAIATYFNKFKVSITPYWFFFSVDAHIEAGDRVSNSALSPDQVKSMLDSQTNVRIDISKAHWGGFIDLSNMTFSKSKSVDKLQADVSIKSIINHYCAYYRCTGMPILDIYAGARSYTFNNDLTLTLGGLPVRSIASSDSWTDPIIGARLMQPFSKNFAGMIGADAGGFSDAQKSMSAYAMLSWAITPSISLNGGYEYLKFSRTKREPIVDTFTMNMTMQGPTVSIGINF